MAAVKIAFEEVCKEYPKLREIGEKYPHLNSCELQVTEDYSEPTKTGKSLFCETSCKSAQFIWNILAEGSIIFIKIKKGYIEKIGPFLVLGTWYYINKYCRHKINTLRSVYFVDIEDGGPAFWAKFLGFKNFEQILRLAQGHSSHIAGGYSLRLPYTIFNKLLEKEWKK